MPLPVADGINLFHRLPRHHPPEPAMGNIGGASATANQKPEGFSDKSCISWRRKDEFEETVNFR
jgi:hypothetical protein